MKRDLRRVTLPARLARALGGFLQVRPVKIACPGGAVSFTFDDFPRSAWTNGGAILEEYGCRGTYYAAMGLAGTANDLGPMFDLADLRAAHARGHEIACHTFSHRDCARVPPREIAAEIDDNAAALSAALGGAAVRNFAYPFGGVSQSAKQALSHRFVSCRGTGRGLIRGAADLADLPSTSLYSRDFDRDHLCQLIDDAHADGAWLICYTHDVADAPSRFGCTPAQFRSLVAYAVENASVLPVRDVLARLGLANETKTLPARAA
ncbi:MAG TPA: polysaccharide deacetylase family protein [Stellaceae bacterium]|nr:polysaccharide deacetylase family protein [Stellaceae bacterium]